jgi:hypothetical protein
MSNPNIKRRGAPAAAALLMALVLAACGGGGGNPGTTGGAGSGSTGNSGGGTGGTGSGGTVTVGAPASVQFVLAAPADKSIVIKGQGGNGRTETATLTFKAVDTNGNPLANQQVNFTTASTDVTINTASARTGADGTVVTTVNSGSKPATFRVQATLPGSAANGKPDLSTLSDTITVTTGLPVQKSFSISSDTFNPEGWSIDSSPATPAAHIQVLLADAFGNPVPDGTPIVFQTNAGSVGSADRGGCTTVNGGCSVDFRAQNPRVPTPGQPATPCNTTGTDGKGSGIRADVNRAGVATICASSTDGTNTLFDSIPIFLSGSAPGHVYLDSVANEVSFSTGAGDLGAFAAAKPRTIWLQLNDVNRNPMPANTKVEVVNPQNATIGTMLPATVPNVILYSATTRDPSGASGYSQGSWHQLTVTPATPSNCSGTQEASFEVKVSTPGVSATAGSSAGPTVTSIPFKLSITCP